MEVKCSHNLLWFLTVSIVVFGMLTNISPAESTSDQKTNAPVPKGGAPVFKGAQPTAITKPPLNSLAHVGDTDIILECTGNPDLNFFWTFTPFVTDSHIVDILLTANNTLIMPNMYNESFAIQNEESNEYNLVILEATADTAGTYRCINKESIRGFLFYDYEYYDYESPNLMIAVAQVIVIKSDPTCTAARGTSSGSVLFTCTISYSGGSFQNQENSGYPSSSLNQPIFTWTAGDKSAGSATTASAINSISLVTVVSTLTLSSPIVGQSYVCSVTFGSPTNRKPGVSSNAPNYSEKCSITIG